MTGSGQAKQTLGGTTQPEHGALLGTALTMAGKDTCMYLVKRTLPLEEDMCAVCTRRLTMSKAK